MPSPLPERFAITTGYGVPGAWAAGHHTGVDYATPVGIEVTATASGRVVHVGRSGGWGEAYGIHVIVDAGSRRYLCAHLSKAFVSEGEQVAAGDRLGRTGNTGNTTGPHLHYEERVSPYRYGTDARRPKLNTGLPAAAISAVSDAPRISLVQFNQADPKAVKMAERALVRLGLMHEGPWATDGQIGDATAASVRRFQKHCGDPVDGRLGPRQWARLGRESGIFHGVE